MQTDVHIAVATAPEGGDANVERDVRLVKATVLYAHRVTLCTPVAAMVQTTKTSRSRHEFDAGGWANSLCGDDLGVPTMFNSVKSFVVALIVGFLFAIACAACSSSSNTDDSIETSLRNNVG